MSFSRTPGTITLANHMHNANFCFCHVTHGTNTRLFQVTPGTMTLTNHMHNANFCFCQVTPGTNTLKSYIQRNLMCFSSNTWN